MTLSVPKHSRARLAAARQDVIRMSRVIPLAGDDMRFTELTQVLRGLSEQLGLETATEGHSGPGAVVGVTVPWGPWLPWGLRASR